MTTAERRRSRTSPAPDVPIEDTAGAVRELIEAGTVGHFGMSEAAAPHHPPRPRGALTQKPWIVPIPGTRKLGRLEENLAAADLELTASDVAEIDTASAGIEVQSARYPEATERLIDS